MSTSMPAKKKPGPKAKPVTERALSHLMLNHGTRRKIPRRSYTREFKLKALKLMKENVTSIVSKQLGVSERLLRDWTHKEDKILASRVGSRTVEKTQLQKGRWNKMEERLFEKFREERDKGRRPAGRRWFEQEGGKIFAELYPDAGEVCKFSSGWFEGFSNRWKITSRGRVKSSSKPKKRRAAQQSLVS